MAKNLPSTLNLTVGAIENGWKVVEVIDGATAKYVVEKESTATSGSATVQTGAHAFNETSTTNPSSSFAVTFPQPFANPPRVDLQYQWNYNASTNGGILSPPVVLDGAPSTTGFNYRINGNRNTLDRVLWTAIDPQTTIQAGSQLLTPRAITGSVTATGYDAVPVPCQIILAQDKILDTVTATNGAVISNINPTTGTFNVTVNGQPTAVTHTTKSGATYSGLQMVGEFNPPANTVYDTLATVTTGIDFTRCDLIEWQIRLTSDLRTISSFVPVVIGGSTPTMEAVQGSGQLSSFIANAADAALGKLTNVDCHGVAFETVKIRGWANALNKVVVPSASTVLTPRKITGSITSDGYDGVDLPYLIPLSAGLVLDTVSLNGTATTNFDANTGIVRIKPNGGDVAVTHTTKAGATYSGLQMVGESNHNNTVINTTGVSFTLAATLLDGDLLEIVENYNNAALENHIHWPRATAGQTFTMYQYPATGNSCTVIFPSTLDNKVTIKGGTNQYIRTIRIWRNSANGYCLPTATTLFTPRNITGTGIAVNTVGRDNTVSTIRITGLTAGSEILAGNISASGGATIEVVDSGRNGAATVDVIPNGAATVITYTQTVWQRTLTETGGALINGVASQNIDATLPYSSSIAIPAGQYLQTLTATNATIVKFVETGAFTINPTNAGNVVLTATFAAASATDFIHVVATADQTTGLSVGSPVLFSTPTVHNSAGVTFSNGVFTLPANKTFRLESQITYAGGSELIVRWRNITANTLIGNAANPLVGGRGNIASAMISTTQVTTVRLEITLNNAVSSITAADTYSRASWAYIKEVDRIVFAAPTGTTLFTARTITGTGITATQGRDNTSITVPITGITVGSQVASVSANGGATALIIDSGKGGTAYVEVIPNGADTVISNVQTVWRRAMTATVNGAAGTINGAASVNVDATKAVAFWLTIPATHRLSAAPTITGGTLLSWSADGFGEILPDNTGAITVTANSIAISPVAKGLATANAGVAVVIGTLRLTMPTSGNRSWQVQSNTGANLTLQVQNLWSNGGHGNGVLNITATAGTWTYFNSGWNFTAAGDWQNLFINDVSSGRWYNIRCEVGPSYNNCSYSWFEIV